MTTAPLLSIHNLHVAYGGIQAVKGISLHIDAGEVVSLIGANGAGKSTALKAITGLHPSAADTLHYQGQSILGLGAWDIAARGLVMVPEGRGIFARMSILENLGMGAFLRKDADVAHDLAHVFELFPRLKERAGQLGGTLSGGEQQMLAMGRALMARPTMLLLDEPSMGLSPIMVDQIFAIIEGIAKRGVTILLIEQNARRALALSDRAYVLDSGHITLSGAASVLLNDAQVQAAYLGL
jgi:branched-chain amino acid transport system ATP-binding protein